MKPLLYLGSAVLASACLIQACHSDSGAKKITGVGLSFLGGYGQPLSALWCRKDSCYSLLSAPQDPRPARVGFFGTGVNPGEVAQAEKWALAAMGKPAEPMRPHMLFPGCFARLPRLGFRIPWQEIS